MRSSLAIGCLVFLLWSAVCTAEDWTTFPNHDIYPNPDKRFCVFPFTYNGNTYNDCTLADGNNGNVPWCSLTSDYIGYFRLCYDFRTTTLQCLPSWTMRTGSTMTTYTQCSILSPSIPWPQCKTNNSTFQYIFCVNNITQRITKNFRDRVVCDPKYAALSPNHTTCYGPSEYAVQMPLNSSEQQAMVDMHNNERNNLPDAARMMKVYWDNNLAVTAQAHSARCVFDHDLAINRLLPAYGWKNGQNLAITSSAKALPQLVFQIMLESEKQGFLYGTGCTSSSSTCLHYTQAILDQITRVGCGRSLCFYPDHADTVITCNYLYSQYGNGYMTPYKQSSTPASDCPNHQSGNLCDCGPLACNYDNGEVIDPNTCTCQMSTSKRSAKTDDADSEEVGSKHGLKAFHIKGNDNPEFDQ